MDNKEQSANPKAIQKLWASFSSSAAKMPYLMLALATLAFVLAIIPPLAAFGAVFSVAFLFAAILLQQEGVKQKLAPLAKFIAAIGLVFGLVVNATYSPGHDQDLAESTSAQALEAQQTPIGNGELSLHVTLDEAAIGLEEVKISIDGKTSDGKSIKKSIEVSPGHNKALDLGAGEYTFTYDPDNQTDKAILCKHRSHSIEFSAIADKVVRIELVGDEAAAAAAAAKAEEARIAAEQKAAEEAAEKQRQQEAQQAAEREAAEREAAEQAAKSQSTAGATVYIAASGNGARYHSRSSCSNMKGTISLSISDAQARGYTPCQKCY